jgi:hypothetical protein
MKVTLESKNLPRQGYLNITSQPYHTDNLSNDIQIVSGLFSNLDPILKNETVEEIIFCDYLNKLGPNDMVKIISHWKSKLINGGILKLSYIDIRKICLLGDTGSLTLEELHNLTLGFENNQYRSILDFATFKKICNILKLNIINCDNDNYITNVEIQKNDID